jgi:hypothetical protein
MKTFAALFLPLIATWLASAAWSLLVIHSPMVVPHGAINSGLAALSTLILVLVPFLWLAAWIFCRVVAVHRIRWAFVGSAIALTVLIAPALLTPMNWALPTIAFAAGYLLLFPALVAVMGRIHR